MPADLLDDCHVAITTRPENLCAKLPLNRPGYLDVTIERISARRTGTAGVNHHERSLATAVYLNQFTSQLTFGRRRLESQVVTVWLEAYTTDQIETAFNFVHRLVGVPVAAGEKAARPIDGRGVAKRHPGLIGEVSGGQRALVVGGENDRAVEATLTE